MRTFFIYNETVADYLSMETFSLVIFSSPAAVMSPVFFLSGQNILNTKGRRRMIKYSRIKKKLVIPNGLGNLSFEEYNDGYQKGYEKGYQKGYEDAKSENNEQIGG